MNQSESSQFGWYLLSIAMIFLIADTVRCKTMPGNDNTVQLPVKSSAPDGMAWVPGGEFMMGGDPASEGLCGLPGLVRDATPTHAVYVDGFWMDKTEVTNEEFE